MKKANIKLNLFFIDKPPIKNIKLEVKGERVNCFRLDRPSEIGGIKISRENQYSIMVESDVPVIAQYGRLDTTQTNMAFYTVMGFNV